MCSAMQPIQIIKGKMHGNKFDRSCPHKLLHNSLSIKTLQHQESSYNRPMQLCRDPKSSYNGSNTFADSQNRTAIVPIHLHEAKIALQSSKYIYMEPKSLYNGNLQMIWDENQATTASCKRFGTRIGLQSFHANGLESKSVYNRSMQIAWE